jgi:predicted nucleic acid-binding protein
MALDNGGLAQAVGAGPVALDTVAFIYWIEEHPDFVPLLEPLFVGADQGRREIITSGVTLLEVLVVPYRIGDGALVERYQALLMRSRGVRLVTLGVSQLRVAALLRARHRIRTPDALQLAAALTERCTGFVTNDRDLPVIPGLRVLQLREWLGRGS